MKPELTFILGAMEDGCLTKRESIGDFTIEFDQKNKEWLEELSKCFKVVFGKTSSIKTTKRGFFRLRIHSKEIFQKLENLMKRREELIENSSLECKAKFLRGVFDSESSVHRKRFVIALSNKNTNLLKFCKNLLEDFNIKTGSICKSNKDVFEFCVFGRDNLEKFRQRVGFLHPDRKRKLDELLKMSH